MFRERLRASRQAIIGTSSRTLQHTWLSSGCSLEIGVTISWAIIDDGRSYFNTVLTKQDFDGRGALSFPQSFLAGVLENVRFCNPIKRGNFPAEWMAQPRSDRLRQPTRGTDTQANATGCSAGGACGGESLVAADLDGRLEVEVKAHKNGSVAAMVGPVVVALVAGGGNGGAPRPPTHVAMMNPYLELSNGILSLPSILNAGKIRMEDLSGLDKYKDPTTGRHTFCWAEVLGPCHFPECYFGKKGGHPVQADNSGKFAEQVVQVLGLGVEARMVAMRASDGKRVKVEQGTSNA